MAQTVAMKLLLSQEELPEVVLISASAGDSYCKASFSGEVTNQTAVNERGFCWNTIGSPTINDNFIISGHGTGWFSESISSLDFNKTYYVRAYARNSKGTAYSAQTLTINTIDEFDFTAYVTNLSGTSVDIETIITDNGNNITYARLLYNPVGGSITVVTAPTPFGSYTYQLSGLIPGTNYEFYVSASSSCQSEAVSGTFTTHDYPELTTKVVSNITPTTASSGGDISSDGGSSITAFGLCWNTTGTPTLSDNYSVIGSGVASFVGAMTALSPSTTYYVRAYATNGVGTAYGNERTFTTDASGTLATVTTGAVTNITSSDADVSGEVTSEGGSSVTSRGMCWNTTGNPTLSDAFGGSGNGLGTYVVDVFPLTSNTTYYVRAYATNSSGTAYGNEVSFTTENIVTNRLYAIVINDASEDGVLYNGPGYDFTSNLSSPWYFSSGTFTVSQPSKFSVFTLSSDSEASPDNGDTVTMIASKSTTDGAKPFNSSLHNLRVLVSTTAYTSGDLSTILSLSSNLNVYDAGTTYSLSGDFAANFTFNISTSQDNYVYMIWDYRE